MQLFRICQKSLSGLTRPSQRSAIIFQHLRAMSSSNTEDEVLLERVDTKGIITLNRVKAHNSLNLSMVRKIYPQLKAWDEDASMTMVIIKGAGDKAFCAGGDIISITESGKVQGQYAKDFFKEEYILNNAIGTLGIPWVALIDGITMGGGVGLSVHGMFRVATEKTLFAMPETAVGLFPDVGGGYFLPRIGGNLGMYLALSGFRLRGVDVLKAGVATHFVDSASIPDLEKDLLALDNPKPQDIGHVIDSYQKKSAYDEKKEFILAPYMNQIHELFEGNTLEEVFRKLEQDGSEWALKQLNTLKKMSPTSMKVAFRQLKEGAKLSLQDDLVMEYRCSQRFTEDHDFYEGVRAVLLDKDQNPKWKPATIEEVTDEHVDWYFSPLPEDRELKL